jgi:hypothetical protein
MRYLCQRPPASCGACCGLSNRADTSGPALAAELWRRTRALGRVERTEAAFRETATRLAAEAAPPLFPSIRVCQLLGFLDEAGTRIGCLAHPLATGGLDLRSAGAYDVLTCEAFLCPSHARLADAEAQLVAVACAGWNLYGLVVTDAAFVRAVLDAVAARTGSPVAARDLADQRRRFALRHLFALKEELEAGSEGLFGAFGDRREAAAPGHAGATEPDQPARAPGGAILNALGADARSGNDLDRLEVEVERRLDACAAAFARA